MAWVLNAAGNCPAEDEADLAAELADVLAQYGATASQLTGEASNGPVHFLPEEPEPKVKDKQTDAAAG